MGESVTTVNINLSHLESRVNMVADTTRRIEAELHQTNGKVDDLKKDLGAVNRDLQELRQSFETFVNDNKKAVALQKAATELVRVRQEIEQNFGNYRIVRETMLGVLQATDLALVRKTTISQVTEELMLSTPDYWLAPCLVAVSAWIGNDRDLANRAITEAMKRDEEKTALAMALICRRNNRTETCYEWLSIYFAKQSAAHFTESNFTYLNAYLNGVFGPDEKHMCDDYVAKWMQEIQSNEEDVAAKQTELWRDYCKDFTVDLDGQFPQMQSCVPEYEKIVEYVGRINSVDQISGNFSRMKHLVVDQQKLKKDIDQTLVTLISRCDEKEEPLRKEEKYLLAIRQFDGDTMAAKASILEASRRRTEETIDLIGQMTNVIVKKDDTRPSEKKTAVSFLSSYIRGGFESYITEKKADFPEQITLQIEGWEGKTADGSNVSALKTEFTQYMNRRCAEKIQAIQSEKPKKLRVIAIVLALLGAVLLIPSMPIAVILLAAAGLCGMKARKMVKNAAEYTAAVNRDFGWRIGTGMQRINEAVAEWKSVQNTVQKFEAEKPRDVVA